MSPTKLLYVEDEPFLAKIVKESLESRDYEVHLIQDGRKAMPAFEQQDPDLVILDVMLPHVDGFTIGQEIRQIDKDTPILYLTAKTQTSDLLEGFQAGGNDYIKKPFSMEELIVRIENLLTLTQGRRAQIDTQAFVEIGTYKFYPQKFELHQGDSVKSLSHRETQLLKIFAQHRNLPVDRKLILNEVWGDDSFFNSRNLDVYIKKLRDYLKLDERIRIVTLKGVGYHFVVEE